MSRYRALIVDDELQVRHTIARALRPLGFDCELASDGRDALELLQRSVYDLVVTDLKMPDINGHKLATALLGLERRPIISVLTGIVQPKLADDLSTRGVERIYYKPVDYKEFARELLNLVEQRRTRYSAIASSLYARDQADVAERPANHSASELGNDRRGLAMQISTTELDQAHGSSSNSKEHSLRPSVPNDRDATNTNGTMATGDRVENTSSGWHISNGFAIKIEAELLRTKRALLELQNTVAAGQNQSYFCLAIALGAGLIGGLILGWLSSQLFGPTAVFHSR